MPFDVADYGDASAITLVDRLRIYEAQVAAAMKAGRDVDASFGLLQVLQESIELCERTENIS